VACPSCVLPSGYVCAFSFGFGKIKVPTGGCHEGQDVCTSVQPVVHSTYLPTVLYICPLSRPNTLIFFRGILRRSPPPLHTYIHPYIRTYVHTRQKRAVSFHISGLKSSWQMTRHVCAFRQIGSPHSLGGFLVLPACFLSCCPARGCSPVQARE
jgi:hypothetical protein